MRRHGPSCKRVGGSGCSDRFAAGTAIFLRSLDAGVLLHAHIHGRSIAISERNETAYGTGTRLFADISARHCPKVDWFSAKTPEADLSQKSKRLPTPGGSTNIPQSALIRNKASDPRVPCSG